MAILGSSDNQTQQINDVITSLSTLNVGIQGIYSIQSKLLNLIEGNSVSDKKGFSALKDTMERQTVAINRYFNQNFGSRNTSDVASAQVSSTTKLISSQNGNSNEAVNAEVEEVAKAIRESTQKLVEASKNANTSNETVLKLIGVMEKQATNMEAISKIVKDIKEGKISTAEDFYKKTGTKLSDADKKTVSPNVDNAINDIKFAFKDYDQREKEDDENELKKKSNEAILEIRDAIINQEKDKKDKKDRTYKKEKKNDVGGLGGGQGISMSTFGLPSLAALGNLALIAGGVATLIGILEAWKSDKEWKGRLDAIQYTSNYRRNHSLEDTVKHIREKFGNDKAQYEASVRWLNNAENAKIRIASELNLEPPRKEGPKQGESHRASEISTQHANMVDTSIRELIDSYDKPATLGWMLGPTIMGSKFGLPGIIIGASTSATYASYKLSDAYWKGVEMQNDQEHVNSLMQERKITELADYYKKKLQEVQPALLKFKHETVAYMANEWKNLMIKFAVLAQRGATTDIFGIITFETPTNYSKGLIAIYEAIRKIFDECLEKIMKDETFDNVIKHRQEFIDRLKKMMDDNSGPIRRFYDKWINPYDPHHFESSELRDEFYGNMLKKNIFSSQSINTGRRFEDVPAFGKGSNLPNVIGYDFLPWLEDRTKTSPFKYNGHTARITGEGNIEIFKKGRWMTVPRNLKHDLDLYGENGLMTEDNSVFEYNDKGKVRLMGGEWHNRMEDAHLELLTKLLYKLDQMNGGGQVVNINAGNNPRSVGPSLPLGSQIPAYLRRTQ